MFKFGEEKLAQVRATAQTGGGKRSVPQSSQEYVDLGGGKANALPKAVEAASDKLNGLGAEGNRAGT